MTDDLLLHAAQAALVATQWGPRLALLASTRGLPVAATGATTTAASTATATTSTAAATGTVSSVATGTVSTTATVPGSAVTTAAGTTSTAPGTTTTTTTDFPTILLSTLIWAALLAAVVILFLPERTKEQRDRIRVMGLVGAGFPVLLAAAGINFEIAQDLLGGQTSFEERHSWITTFPVHVDYHVAADGVSLPILLLSTLMFMVVMAASWRVERRTKLYVVLLLLLETGLNGSLCSFDYVLLLLFQGLEIVPMFLLIAIWGGEARRTAAWRFLGFAATSWGLLLACVVLVGLKADQGSFTFLQVGGVADSGVILTGGVATACFWLSFAAFAIRLPVVPLHTWMTGALGGASAPVAAIIGGIWTTTGGYLLLRVTLPGFPSEAHRYSLVLAALAVITAVWGAVGALGQDDLRRLIAYTGMAQVGVVLLAIAAQSSIALNGAVLMLVAHGLAIGLLLLLTGTLQERTRTRSISRLGGLAWQMPKLTAIWVVGGLTAVGVPFLAGFIAEFEIFTGSYPAHRVATVVVMGATAVSTAAILWMLQRVFFGPAREAFQRVRDASTLELVYLVPVLVVVLAFGVVPGRIIPIINSGVELITSRLSGA